MLCESDIYIESDGHTWNNAFIKSKGYVMYSDK